MDYINHNREAWNNYVQQNNEWTVPVGEEEISKAKQGHWSVVLTPTKAVPSDWFPPINGLIILGLASGGGQQGPILAAAGAEVTVFDNSENQLKQDQTVSDLYDLHLKTVQGDMRDLSVFEDESFDLIFNPCSICFVDELEKIWKECFRVLKPGGVLMTGFFNPVVLLFDEETKTLKYKQPFSEIEQLPKDELQKLIDDREALQFGHSLESLIGGQLQAGFLLSHLYEDDWNGRHFTDAHFPGFIATRAVKTTK